jgi:hypothetical protein
MLDEFEELKLMALGPLRSLLPMNLAKRSAASSVDSVRIFYSDHLFRPGNRPCLTLNRSFVEVRFLRIVRHAL